MIRGSVIFSGKAENDIYSIGDWYYAQKHGLEEEFMADLVAAIKKVEKNPASFRFIKRNVRRCKLKRFPYYAYFSTLNGITVLRIRHIKQQPLKRFT